MTVTDYYSLAVVVQLHSNTGTGTGGTAVLLLLLELELEVCQSTLAQPGPGCARVLLTASRNGDATTTMYYYIVLCSTSSWYCQFESIMLFHNYRNSLSEVVADSES